MHQCFLNVLCDFRSQMWPNWAQWSCELSHLPQVMEQDVRAQRPSVSPKSCPPRHLTALEKDTNASLHSLFLKSAPNSPYFLTEINFKAASGLLAHNRVIFWKVNFKSPRSGWYLSSHFLASLGRGSPGPSTLSLDRGSNPRSVTRQLCELMWIIQQLWT